VDLQSEQGTESTVLSVAYFVAARGVRVDGQARQEKQQGHGVLRQLVRIGRLSADLEMPEGILFL
jgi:hypothetical protein